MNELNAIEMGEYTQREKIRKSS